MLKGGVEKEKKVIMSTDNGPGIYWSYAIIDSEVTAYTSYVCSVRQFMGWLPVVA